MVRASSTAENGMRRGGWSKKEDDKLRAYINRYGIWNWRQLPKYAGLSRCGKSCRLRWKNYLQPNIKRGSYSKQEEDIILNLHDQLGKKWSIIAESLPGRTDNEIKNYWHTHLKKSTTKLQNPNDNVEMIDSSQASFQKPEMISSWVQTNSQQEESSQYSNNDDQKITTPGSKGSFVSPIFNESSCSDQFSQSYSDHHHHHAPFESPNGSCCSKLSLDSTFCDLMSWDMEDSNIITTSFESLAYNWGNHEISSHHNEGQFTDPGLVCPDSPITEEIVLWSW